MKNIATAFFFLVFTVMIFSQTANMNISKVGPKTIQIYSSQYAQIYYVSQKTGSDKKGNGYKANPWKTVFHALNSVKGESENHRVAVFVAEGDYAKVTVIMKEYVDLFGGFSTDTWERDIYKYSTILDGSNARRVVMGADNATLDGFTVKNGLSRSHGGGILCDDSAPTISNCFIVDNYALEPSDFDNQRIHQHGNEGGGVACLYDATPHIENNLFYNNRTSIGDGGALSFYGWSRKRHGTSRRIENNFMVGYIRPVVRNNIFAENTAGVNDIFRTRSSNGGAISCSHEARPIIENNVIVSNRAKGNSDAGGIYAEDFSYPTINGNWIVGNITDDDGGGMYIMRTSHALITNNIIAGNWTMNGGAGGIRLSKEGRATITDNIIVDNQSGGGVQCIDSYMELKNNIIMNNKGKTSIRYSNTFSYFIPTQIENNIVLNNEGKIDLELRKGETINFNNNDVNEKVPGKNNRFKPVTINNQNITGTIRNYLFDDSNYQTIIETKNLDNTKSLEGRVIRIGKFWSVIDSVENNKVYVWGNLEQRESNISKFTILPLYTKLFSR